MRVATINDNKLIGDVYLVLCRLDGRNKIYSLLSLEGRVLTLLNLRPSW
jgi:hypothetical protein